MAETLARTVDVREITPRERHPLIFSTFDGLRAGESMMLVNDHDPKPLHYQFQVERAGRFAWDTLQSGPDEWRVRITKKAKHGEDGVCCGSCGGS